MYVIPRGAIVPTRLVASHLAAASTARTCAAAGFATRDAKGAILAGSPEDARGGPRAKRQDTRRRTEIKYEKRTTMNIRILNSEMCTMAFHTWHTLTAFSPISHITFAYI